MLQMHCNVLFWGNTKKMPNFRSNLRPLNIDLEKNALHIWIQNDLSFSKRFEIWKSDKLWQMNNPTDQRKRACISAPIILFKLLELAKWPLLAGPSCLERKIGAEIPALFLWSMLYCRLCLDYCRCAKTQNQWILNALILKSSLAGFIVPYGGILDSKREGL